MILATLIGKGGLRSLVGQDVPPNATVATAATERPKTIGPVAPVATIAGRSLGRTKKTFRQNWDDGLTRLDTTKAPAQVPPRRWRQFINDAFSFTSLGWADQAASLGWLAVDLVGCDRTKPFERIDRAGLLWFLNGAIVVALTEAAAVIETPSGARQSHRRRHEDPDGRVLAWELDGRDLL